MKPENEIKFRYIMLIVWSLGICGNFYFATTDTGLSLYLDLACIIFAGIMICNHVNKIEKLKKVLRR